MHAGSHPRSVHPETPSPGLGGERLCILLKRITVTTNANLPARLAVEPANRGSSGTTSPFFTRFQHNLNNNSTLQCIVLPNPCRIITIQKPCRNKIRMSRSLNSSESVSYPFHSRNLRFEKYYQHSSQASRFRLLSHKSELPAPRPPRYPSHAPIPSCMTEGSNDK